ncbi:MAG: TonB-dependent receptor [Candidatus Polarisedimenticolaceae bacterium]|nr:TonB-dependent receptor [Candidatus Polarisedimenticolaceae bacterium]
MKFRQVTLFALLSFLSQVGSTDTMGLDELSLFFEESDLLELATKQPQSVKDAPATATIITADEIRKMGVSSIHEVLRRAANFDINISPYGKYQIEIRGMQDPGNNKIRFMIDGFTVQDELTQSASWIFDSLSLHNVKRIEVIRGPASALYGTSAFAGIVNIITKDGNDIDGTTASIGYGTFNTKNANILTGGQLGDVEYAFSIDSYSTDGDSLYVAEDKVGNSGYTDHWQEQLDLGIKLHYQGWRLNSRYLEKRRGPYIGISHQVNKESEMTLAQYFVELRHKYAINEKINQNITFFYNKVTDFNQYWDSPSAVYPDPNYLNNRIQMESYGTQLQFDYQLNHNHLLTLGGELEHHEIYDAAFHIGFAGPSGPMIDITEIANWIDDKKTQRGIWAIYLQDIWQLRDDLEVTLGARYDKYSDFGDSLSPKLAAVWKLTDTWDLKALYSHGFKAPSFAELYLQAGAQNGDPDLKAETTDSYEVSLSHKIARDHAMRLTYFKVYHNDRIDADLTGEKTANTAGTLTEGIELELKKFFRGGHVIYANYTYQDARFRKTDDRLAYISDQKGNIGGNFAINRQLNFNFNIFARSDKPREEGDERDDVKGHVLTDIALIATHYIPKLELRGSISNLFDVAYDDPSPYESTISDYPREGRSYMVDLSYRF